MLLVGDPRALEKIQDQKIYREYARQYEEKINFPKEFQITMLIDLS